MINVRHLFRNLTTPEGLQIPASVTVSGSIDAAVPGRIDGTVEGDVKTTGKLIVSETARIKGHVFAAELILNGKVYGNVYVSDRAQVLSTAHVKGDVNAFSLEVEVGAHIGGVTRKDKLAVQELGKPVQALLPDVPVEPKPVEKVVVPEEEQPTSWF
ncbi:Polymer-forming protein [Chitinophaga jiangningensis]|uniref:Polymer-forming protein n=1 Tax=Chitinophaga jiangningensis TaxID=1419482 RepID=A0A1M7AL87_9BACT|nr:polymer-forming cytoskeletal protein [Chitinophaga jiangningensis]SHL43266.1 Polymer-forming protein [Chitinophaga jiangningensis]